MAGQFMLRPYKDNDKFSLMENINNENINRYMSMDPFPLNEDDATSFIGYYKKGLIRQHAREIGFAIDVNSSAVGGVLLTKIRRKKAEIGYWLGRKYWGQGITTEAIALVVQFAFKYLDVIKIYGEVYHPNLASIRVLEKTGFELEKIKKETIKKENKTFDLYVFVKTKQGLE